MLAQKLFTDNDYIIVRFLGHSFYTLSRKRPFGQLSGCDIGNWLLTSLVCRIVQLHKLLSS